MERPPGVLPMTAYTGRLHPKGVPFSGVRNIREGISPVEVRQRVEKSVISVAKMAQIKKG